MKTKSKNLMYHIDGPLLDKVTLTLSSLIDFNQYPFCLNIIKQLKEIKFTSQVTFFVGENGTGKSTILEAIAHKVGFGSEGGNKNINFETSEEKTYKAKNLSDSLTLSWRCKPKYGYFFRAESFFNVANYIDQLAQADMSAYVPYGGKSLHEQSHGESFLAFFKHNLSDNSFYILDEPEAALSPQRQLSLMIIIHELCKGSHAQFIIATHSPILLAYPDATIYSCDSGALKQVAYNDTEHYKITKRFLEDPNYYLHHLFSSE